MKWWKKVKWPRILLLDPTDSDLDHFWYTCSTQTPLENNFFFATRLTVLRNYVKKILKIAQNGAGDQSLIVYNLWTNKDRSMKSNAMCSGYQELSFGGCSRPLAQFWTYLIFGLNFRTSSLPGRTTKCQHFFLQNLVWNVFYVKIRRVFFLVLRQYSFQMCSYH